MPRFQHLATRLLGTVAIRGPRMGGGGAEEEGACGRGVCGMCVHLYVTAASKNPVCLLKKEKQGRRSQKENPRQPPRSSAPRGAMAHAAVYEEVPFSELELVEDDDMYYYECPCGDMFEISPARYRRRASLLSSRRANLLPSCSQAQLAGGERIARCPSCSLTILIIDYPGESGADGGMPRLPPAVPVSR